MKKRYYALLAAVIILLFCSSCKGSGTESEGSFTFRNEVGAKITTLCISPARLDSWGENLLARNVRVNRSIRVDVEMLVDGPGQDYDIKAIDKDGKIFEVYSIYLDVGFTVVLTFDGTAVTAAVTDAEGHTTVYNGVSFLP